jgi:hypothetical protein
MAVEGKYVPSGEGNRKARICVIEKCGKAKVEKTSFEY